MQNQNNLHIIEGKVKFLFYNFSKDHSRYHSLGTKLPRVELKLI